jgi:tRNA threonylcarbamoyladenosine biosynthesis protein TsaB
LTIVALDTSSAAGSAALVIDGRIMIERAGDPSRTHGARLPLELMTLLDEEGVALASVDRFAVSIGPGSFTGLRVGIASIQGLALANGKLVSPVTTFEALAQQASESDHDPVAVWIDAHRGEVFAALFAPDARTVLRDPSALSPAATLDAWADGLGPFDRIRFAGDGAIRYHDIIRQRLGDRAAIPAQIPPLAGIIGEIAHGDPARAIRPHAVVPLYVRRPDAELARDRRRQA